MKIVWSVLKYVLYFIVLLVVYALITVVLSYIPENSSSQKESGTIPIYIMTNGVHTDIVTPYENNVWDWSQWLDLSVTPEPLQNTKWVSFGWGDKGFYMETPEWKDLKPSVALKAAFYLSSSAMHVTYYNDIQLDEDTRVIWLTDEQYKNLSTYIFNQFSENNNSFELIDTDQNYGKHDVFYEAKGRYSLFYTCNTWANNGLKAADQKASLFTLWDKGIFYHYN